MPNTVDKFTTTTTVEGNQPPVAVLAVTRIDAIIGAIIQLDGRQSSDPEGQPITFSWSFNQVPIGSTAKDTGFRNIRPSGTAVSFVPDKIGVYVVQLIVNDGELDSVPATVTVSIQISRVPCGENIIPDAQFLYDHISNFWNLVEDREILTSIWSSVIQLIGADLLKTWSNDNNKSFDTIQPSFQRRWLEYLMVTDLLGEFDQRIIVGKTDSGTGGTTGNLGATPGVESTSVFVVPKGDVGEVTKTDFTNLKGNYGDKGRVIVVNEELFTISSTRNSPLTLESGADLVTTIATNQVSSASASFETEGIQVGDSFTIKTGADAGSFLVKTVVDENNLELSTLNPAIDPSFAGDTDEEFEVARTFSLVIVDEEAIPDGQIGVSWRVPNLLHIPEIDFEEENVRAGDIVTFEVTRKDIGLTTDIEAQVVGVDGNRLGFEFTLETLTPGSENIEREIFKKIVQDLKIVNVRAIESEVDAAAEALISFVPPGINLNTRPFSTFLILFKAKNIRHNTAITVDSELISVPVFQEQLIDPPVVLRENLDYVIEDSALTFVGSLFTLKDPAPERFWAECSYFDNGQVIENNFGRLVSLTREDLTSKKTQAPYLSAVKGLFFALTNGPTVANIRLGLQILLGLPFTEARGEILEIQDNFTFDVDGNPLGRILIEDIDENDNRTGFRRISLFPTVVGLEINPSTRQTFKVGDRVEQFVPLSKGIEVQDYIKTPRWWVQALLGLEILKFFTFKVAVDSDIFDIDDATFALEFIKTIKPSYTDVITTAVATLVDDIDVEDFISGSIGLKFYDNAWGLEATSRLNDQNQQGCALWHLGSRPFSTRTLKILRDVVTADVGGNVRATSVAGWNSSFIRARSASGVPVVEGDILHIHKGQLGSSVLAPGLYEISQVIDGNTIELLVAAPGNDPTTYDIVPLDPNLFEFGTDLISCILRRSTNPVLRGADLETFAANNEAESLGSDFLNDEVGVGDHLIIESGANLGEYIINELNTPPASFISATRVALVNTDGTIPVFTSVTSQSFRIIRPLMQSKVVPGGRSIFNSGPSQIELEVLDPVTGDEFDVFTPGMVGTIVSVSNSQNPVNDGDFLITQYLGPGKVATDSASVTSDTGAQSVVHLR